MFVSQKEILCRRTNFEQLSRSLSWFPTVLIIFIFGNYFQTLNNQDLCVFEERFILLLQKKSLSNFQFSDHCVKQLTL